LARSSMHMQDRICKVPHNLVLLPATTASRLSYKPKTNTQTDRFRTVVIGLLNKGEPKRYINIVLRILTLSIGTHASQNWPKLHCLAPDFWMDFVQDAEEQPFIYSESWGMGWSAMCNSEVSPRQIIQHHDLSSSRWEM
jgi:hypothetical protein